MQSRKAFSPMVDTEAGMSTDCKFLHRSKAWSPMVVTDVGMSTDCSSSQCEKAPGRISETEGSITTCSASRGTTVPSASYLHTFVSRGNVSVDDPRFRPTANSNPAAVEEEACDEEHDDTAANHETTQRIISSSAENDFVALFVERTHTKSRFLCIC